MVKPGDRGRDVTAEVAARTATGQTNYGGYDPFAADIATYDANARQQAQARVLQAQAQAQRAQAQAEKLRQSRANMLGFGVQLGGAPTGTLSNRATPDFTGGRELANMSGGSRPAPKAPKFTSTGPSASDIRRQQEADAKREAARREADRLRISKAPKVDPKAEAAKAKKDKEKQRGIELAEKAMKEAMKRAEQLRKDREFRKKQQKKKPKSHAFF